MQIKLKSKGFLCFVVVLCLGLFFLYQKEFRITYAPDLENNWDAISGSASWVSAIASFLAVWYAIQISDKQNKIALFEKRYSVYKTFSDCQDFSNHLMYTSTNSVKYTTHVKKCFCAVFFNIEKDGAAFTDEEILIKGIEINQKLTESKFLYSPQIYDYIIDIGKSIELVVAAIVSSDTQASESFTKQYCKKIGSSEFDVILNKMEQELDLTKC
ncbi:MAG: hypothetical protein MR880_06730 [Negativibacillus massiliensis]|nr:hypothetical protein [Negativibacillus massiliensis]